MATTYTLDDARTEVAETPTHRVVLTYRPWMGWSVHTVRIGTHDIYDARDFRDDEAGARRYANDLYRTRGPVVTGE